MNLRSHRGRPWLSAFGRRTSLAAYLLIECLVYISVLFLLLGAGYVALDRCIDHSVVLRRTADDISNALHAGERWRADVRAANGNIRLENKDGEQLVYLTTPRGKRTYRFSSGSVFRSVDQGPWTRLLPNVQSSTMQSDPRRNGIAWRWELELQPRTKGIIKPGRVRPLFTFIAVPASNL